MSIDYEKLKILPLNFPKSYTYVYYLCFLGERLRKAGIELHIRYCFAFSQRRFSRCIARFSLWRRNGLHKPQNAFGVKAVRKAHFAVVGAHFQPVTICNQFAPYLRQPHFERFSLWRRNGLHKPQNAFGVKAVRKAHFAVVGAHFQTVTICHSFISLCAKYARLNCKHRQKCRQRFCCRHFVGAIPYHL